MNILSLDPANKFGYALSLENDIEYGTWDFTPRGKQTKGIKLNQFNDKLNSFMKNYGIDLVVYEKPGGRFFGAIRSHSHFEAIILLWCEKNNIKYKDYSATAIKKFITGKGNANKQQVIQSVENLSYNPDDDNQADAIALLLLAKKDHE